jgi:hypothetical protein
VTPFAVSLVLSVAAVGAAYVRAVPVRAAARASSSSPQPVGSTGTALAWSLPVALLVFASATVAIVTLPPRLPSQYDGPMLIGLSCTLALGVGIGVQALARSRGSGPSAGVLGALLSAGGFGVAATAGRTIGLPVLAVVCVLMGAAYGLCLREGLLDVETLAPPSRRGLIVGVFYVVTYIGFGLPLLLVLLGAPLGASLPLAVCAVIALAVAATRTLQLRSGHPAR